MRIGRKTRTGLGLSLGILAGVAMILLPGILTVAHSPFLSSHGFANGNNHLDNSTVTTSPHTSQNNSTSTTTISPTGFAITTAAANSTNTTSTKSTKPPPGSLPSEMPLSAGTSVITASALVLLVSTIVIPALALSFLARTWSTRQANKNLEEHSTV